MECPELWAALGFIASWGTQPCGYSMECQPTSIQSQGSHDMPINRQWDLKRRETESQREHASRQGEITLIM